MEKFHIGYCTIWIVNFCIQQAKGVGGVGDKYELWPEIIRLPPARSWHKQVIIIRKHSASCSCSKFEMSESVLRNLNKEDKIVKENAEIMSQQNPFAQPL